VNKRAIYRLGIISLAHVPMHAIDFPVKNVHVDELSSARICMAVGTGGALGAIVPPFPQKKIKKGLKLNYQ